MLLSYWTEWEQEPQFVKLFLLAHKLCKQMEGFFLWLQIERSPLTTNKDGNVAACCFTAEEWSMQKALGESEPSNKSIVPVLVWIPKKFKLWKSILKSLQEIFFFSIYSNYARALLLYWCRCSGNLFIWKKQDKLRADKMVLMCYTQWYSAAEQ